MGTSAEQAAGADQAAGGAGLPPPPRLPERAAIYIAPDGGVHFGALFEGLLPVAAALRGAPSAEVARGGPPPCPGASPSPGSDDEPG